MSRLVAQLKAALTSKVHRSAIVGTSELVAFCPKCKTLETLWFTGDELIKNDPVCCVCGRSN